MEEGEFAFGNATADGERGWFVGQFIPATRGLRHRRDVEVKWGIHPRGDHRSGWSSYRTSTTLSVLVRGNLRVELRSQGRLRELWLEEPGDYVIFGPGVEHHWESPGGGIVLTVRCPSVPGDLVLVES